MAAAHMHDTAPSSPARQRYADFTGRAFSAFGVSLSFPVLLLSGGILYVAPAGRIATEAGWTVLGLDRGDWQVVHMAAALVFLGFAAWHIFVHLPIYRTLIMGTPAHPGGHRREALLALGIVAIVTLSAALAWPPASWLEDGSRYFRQDHWTAERSAGAGGRGAGR